MIYYNGYNKDLLKYNNYKIYNYDNIKKRLKQSKKYNKRILNCYDKVNRIFDRENKYMVKECTKQIYKKMKAKLENPKLYVNEIFFNKKIKKGGENIKNYDFSYIYAPYEYMLSDYSILENKLKNNYIDKVNKKIINNYNIEIIIYILLISILIYLLFYIYYYNLFGYSFLNLKK